MSLVRSGFRRYELKVGLCEYAGRSNLMKQVRASIKSPADFSAGLTIELVNLKSINLKLLFDQAFNSACIFTDNFNHIDTVRELRNIKSSFRIHTTKV